MEDDRETFEQDQVHQDREEHGLDAPEALAARVLDLMAALREALHGDRGRRNALCTCGGRSDDWENHAVECVWRQQNATVLGRPYATQARLDAEEAEHEEAESVRRAAKAGLYHGSEPEEPRHGARLREPFVLAMVPEHAREALEHISFEIDKDADKARLLVEMSEEIARGRAEVAEATREDLRQKVEEAVERLRYSVTTWETDEEHPSLVPSKRNRRDVLDAESFLAELDRIFGDRPAGPPPTMVTTKDATWFEVPGRGGAKGLRVAINPDGEVFLGPIDPAVGAGFALSAEAACELTRILRAFLPGDFAQAVDPRDDIEGYARRQFLEPLLHPEHEPAHDRRERQAARFEDRDGKVEGVDR